MAITLKQVDILQVSGRTQQTVSIKPIEVHQTGVMELTTRQQVVK